jgi:Na+-transporting NADH:ubiquinone oxidoreductase subunit NqrC
LKLQGASCRNNALFYSSSIMDDIPLLAVEWKMPNTTASSEKKNDQDEITLPVYGNGLRTELLCTMNVKSGQANAAEFHFYERGVAVLASSLE